MTWDYHAPRWLPGGNLQTIYAAKLATTSAQKNQPWQRERWHTPDGDFVDVDWINRGLAGHRPMLVLFHGLEGSSSSHYARAFAAQAMERGWTMAVPHFRGCSGEINLAPRAYHSGDDNEIAWMLGQCRQRHDGRMVAVGISLGGNALMRWAGVVGHAAGHVLQGAASVCAPLDLTASAKNAVDKHSIIVGGLENVIRDPDKAAEMP